MLAVTALKSGRNSRHSTSQIGTSAMKVSALNARLLTRVLVRIGWTGLSSSLDSVPSWIL